MTEGVREVTNEPVDISRARPGDSGEQESYLAPLVPPGYINPPSGTQFANATWMHAGPEIRRYVEQMVDSYEEFADIAGVDYTVTWRRQTKPMRGDEPVFASVEITPPRLVWEAAQIEAEGFPRFVIDLHWTHFDDLRRGKTPGEPERQGEQQTGAVGAQYVHHGTLQQHIHHALMGLTVENDIIRRRPPEFTGFAATVRRFGQWNLGIVSIARQLALWPGSEG